MQTETILYEACIKYREFTSEDIPLFGVFLYWFAVLNQDIFTLRADLGSQIHGVLQKYRGYTRKRFFDEMLPIAMSSGTTTSSP